MVNTQNNTNVFLTSLGSIGIKKPSSWRNPPNAPPLLSHQRTGKTMRMKVKQIQPVPPPKVY